MGTIAQGASQEVLEGILRASADVERASVARMVAERLGALDSETSHALGAAALELSRLAAELAQNLGYAETVLPNDGVEAAVLRPAVAEPDSDLNGAARPDNTEQIVVEISPAPEPNLGTFNGLTNGSSPEAETQPVVVQAVESPPTTELGLEPAVEPVRAAPVSAEPMLHETEEQEAKLRTDGDAPKEKVADELESTPQVSSPVEKLVHRRISGRELIRLNPDKLEKFLSSRQAVYQYDKPVKLVITEDRTFFVKGVEQKLKVPKDGTSSSAKIETINAVLHYVIEAETKGITIPSLIELIRAQGDNPAEAGAYYQAFRKLEQMGLVVKVPSASKVGTLFGLPKYMEIEDTRVFDEAGEPDFLVRR